MRTPFRLFLAACVAAGAAWTGDASAAASEKPRTYYYKPKWRPPAALEPFLRHLEPGSDEFPLEKAAGELAGRLRELGRALKKDTASGPAALDALLAADFKGGALLPSEEESVGGGPGL